MARAGDTYSVIIKKAHLEWGTHRYTNTRDEIYGEGYIQIPSKPAYIYGIMQGQVFSATSTDGFIDFDVKAAGSQADPDYAKQFEGNGDLKAIGRWYRHCNAQVGDIVEVEFTSPNSVNFTFIRTT